MAFWLACQLLSLVLLPLSPAWAAAAHLGPQSVSASCLGTGDHDGIAHHDAGCAAICQQLNQTALPALTPPGSAGPLPMPLPILALAAGPQPHPAPPLAASPRGPPPAR